MDKREKRLERLWSGWPDDAKDDPLGLSQAGRTDEQEERLQRAWSGWAKLLAGLAFLIVGARGLAFDHGSAYRLISSAAVTVCGLLATAHAIRLLRR